MKLSDLIKELQADLKESGDVYILESKVVDENQYTGHSMYSPTRKKKNGDKAKMSSKEFEVWVKAQKNKCKRCDGKGFQMRAFEGGDKKVKCCECT
jgi:adenylylsulfate kinase-like enzyme